MIKKSAVVMALLTAVSGSVCAVELTADAVTSDIKTTVSSIKELPKTPAEVNDFMDTKGKDELKKQLDEKIKSNPDFNFNTDKEGADFLLAAIEGGNVEALEIIFSIDKYKPDPSTIKLCLEHVVIPDNDDYDDDDVIKNRLLSFFSKEEYSISDSLIDELFEDCCQYVSGDKLKKLTHFISNCSFISNDSKDSIFTSILLDRLDGFHCVGCDPKWHANTENYEEVKRRFMDIIDNDFIETLCDKNMLNVTAGSIVYMLSSLFSGIKGGADDLYTWEPFLYSLYVKTFLKIISDKNIPEELKVCILEGDEGQKAGFKKLFSYLVTTTEHPDFQENMENFYNIPFSDKIKDRCFKDFVREFTSLGNKESDDYNLNLKKLAFGLFPVEFYETNDTLNTYFDTCNLSADDVVKLFNASRVLNTGRKEKILPFAQYLSNRFLSGKGGISEEVLRKLVSRSNYHQISKATSTAKNLDTKGPRDTMGIVYDFFGSIIPDHNLIEKIRKKLYPLKEDIKEHDVGGNVRVQLSLRKSDPKQEESKE